jgi:hypothetical protein
MGKSRFRVTTENEQVSDDIDTQIKRLRQVLVLMQPETGSVALGAMRRAEPDMPLAERVRLLTEYRR